MNTIVEYLKVNTSKAPLGFVLALLFILEVLTGGYFGLQQPPAGMETMLVLSEIDGPTIDGSAAMTSSVVELCANAFQFPAVWFLALLVMIGLLVVNFAWALTTKDRVEWVPEAGYVFLMMATWAFVDNCFTATWFPVTLIKVSLIIFALYLYLLERKTKPTLF